ncbi:Nudix hydrolase 20, chloroplastic [Ananas comosus]|uniref:Nudix hydrolase 20, chloroplastic n=1 Tax=Ananas comosus TaxID=4615 RepID=A0A199W8D3_ANACO|nr:Nudix hydrolase 20, chloroplastic [Ananas comosus]
MAAAAAAVLRIPPPPLIPPLRRLRYASPRRSHPSRLVSSASAAAAARFAWDDALTLAADEGGGASSDLRGFFERVRTCNRGSELKSEFVPFFVEEQIVGYVHKGFVEHLRKFNDVITVSLGNNGRNFGEHITLHPSLRAPDDRTIAVGNIIKCLGELIPGIRNELYPVTSSYGMPVFFSLERAAAPYFGIKAYGVHMNGYVEKDGQKFLWIGKRSDTKPTFPGMLDHLVAGGLPYGITCKENVIKECEEEAGIPRSISNNAIPVGAVSYTDIEGYRYKRDVLFCYDLRLPADFIPKNEGEFYFLVFSAPNYGEVDSFRLVPVSHVANIIQTTEFFKQNCNLVIIDFLFRHGYINPDSCGYLQLLQSLRSGDCS